MTALASRNGAVSGTLCDRVHRAPAHVRAAAASLSTSAPPALPQPAPAAAAPLSLGCSIVRALTPTPRPHLLTPPASALHPSGSAAAAGNCLPAPSARRAGWAAARGPWRSLAAASTSAGAEAAAQPSTYADTGPGSDSVRGTGAGTPEGQEPGPRASTSGRPPRRQSGGKRASATSASRRTANRGGQLDELDAVLFVGFHPEEMELVRQNLPSLFVPDEDESDDGKACLIGDVTLDMLSYTVPAVLKQLLRTSKDGPAAGASSPEEDGAAAAAEAASTGGGGEVAVAAGRVVLLVGAAAQAAGGALNDHLAEWGVVPALIAGYSSDKSSVPLAQLVASLRQAHARYYELLQPVTLEPLPGLTGPRPGPDGPGASAPAEGKRRRGRKAAELTAAAEAATEGAAAAAAAADAGAEAAEARAAAHLAVLADTRVVLNAALDAGEVPSIHGTYRRDAGHVVVLDGLLSEAERLELLDCLTAPGHNHQGPPPESKWDMGCVDREGDRATWGLRPEVLASLLEAPPPPVVALQTRLAAIYPEYDICHMPADKISDDPPNADGEGTPLSCFVGNAVMHGDPCAWHCDADPATLPPHSPWVHNFGYYHNREVGRPLFVTVLIYLNDTWEEDWHAETLFLDPEAALGLFVRPAPGRVVLMEQDVPHRISAPSAAAPGPRYSLVWKLVWLPKPGTAAAGGPPAGSSGGGKGSGKGRGRGKGGRGKGPEAEEGEGQEEGGYQSICRPEWGEPVRIGSANRSTGVPAFQR
ncbi:hypothetical protein HYH03_015528 [Edaphochlamys debaryana]|uniref:Fe2OG dioxygenase domain-containing protein n=1 Tax=Edaphochlamys debaryana TaxID=47281 RepID=A0A836BSJ2_9CHLO|nr:hypothetical protein HYH03_015528 [Edaphochlamys debaryana]|eukprot:KAG2485818.1 hypothetical protein HYH03_015528 [Edaphochlamys debaryana]